MGNREEWRRQQAMERYKNGEKPRAIYCSLGRTKQWFFKWLKRFNSGDSEWFKGRSRRPAHTPLRTPQEIEEVIKFTQLELYNREEFCGAQAILWRLDEQNVEPLPSLRTMGRILARNELTHRRTGRYEPKGTRYPALEAEHPGAVHQADFVGPCFLRKGLRFYSLNTIDLATGRCCTEPTVQGKDGVVEMLWSTWLRLGMPKYLQVDNEAVFYGSYGHPRGMGKLIRLCLSQGVEPCFIPLAEPWRNGVVEKFNDFWRDKFLGRVVMTSEEEVRRESLIFEQRHNSRWRYTKLKGKTPLETLAASKRTLRFPKQEMPPKPPLSKPERGYYHVIRLIRSDRRLNIFGERFSMPPEAVHEYIWATIDVAQQRLSLYLDGTLLDEKEYHLR
ncbi:MAG: IS481 family transposase [Candidatus Hydrogenedentes bacterium]|nr:IS481 family transposase [Candidatus Hydrogenedentota bacterium]